MSSSLICPISSERVDQRTVRLTAGAVAALAVAFLSTGWRLIPLFLLVDFATRGFGSGSASALRISAAAIARQLGTPILIDKAPKLFAARVGVVFSLAILVLGALAPTAGFGVATVLLLFALLESLFNICAGCLVYSYLVAPYFQPSQTE